MFENSQDQEGEKMEGKKKGKYRPNYKEISKIDQIRQPQEYIHQYKKFDTKDNYLYYTLITGILGKVIYELKKAMREVKDFEFYDAEEYENIAFESTLADMVTENMELQDKIYRAIETECIKQAKEYLLDDMEGEEAE